MAAVQSQTVLSSNSIQSLHFDATRFASYTTLGTPDDKSMIRSCESDRTRASCSSLTLNAAEMRRVFQKFDENNDGLICAQDLHRFMSRLGFQMSQDEAVSMLESVDSNGDGRVDFQEFLSLYRSLCDEDAATSDAEKHTEDEDETLLEAFRVFDKNADGYITAEELQTVLLDLGLPEGRSLKNCERMIQSVDVDGNGEIDIREFKEMMSSKYIYCEV
ncbi:hypothetical protein Mapa_012061 [Marchantia paleacea]|nr:hypothetical protein Mapa_012061 [Marchantia paleacea]